MNMTRPLVFRIRQQLNNFKKTWRKYSGKDISDEQAVELLERVVGLMRPVYQVN